MIKLENILNYLRQNKIVWLLGLLLIGVGTGYLLLSHPVSKPKNNLQSAPTVVKKAETKNDQAKNDKKAELFVINVQGAVKKAGVYRVKKGTIVQEALKQAGGLNNNADVKQLNQARKVSDQMQIYVPTIGEAPQKVPGKSKTKTPSAGNNSKIVNINTATVEDFKNVKGVGPKKAERIIKYREEHGSFKQVHDLTAVSGIGEKSLEKVKDQLTV